jgi:hypothetical protein|tara:strand:- start:550 stop:930 length:381 start_codon:yes stop_codon:yes gene_type:complete
MHVNGKKDLEELFKQYRFEEREISPDDYTGSEAEVGVYAYLNLFTATSDGSTYLAANTKVKRNQSSEVATGRSLAFSWRLNEVIILMYDYSQTARILSDFGKELLLAWREHNNIHLQKGTRLEDTI